MVASFIKRILVTSLIRLPILELNHLSSDCVKKIDNITIFFQDLDILGSAMSLRQKIDSFNITRNLTSQRKETETESDVNAQFTSLDMKLVLKRELNPNNYVTIKIQNLH